MILVDASVVSEALKAAPEKKVMAWLERQRADRLHLSTVSIAQMMAGVEAMPAGERRDALAQATERVIERLFGDRILPFDLAAARAYGVARIRARVLNVDIPLLEAEIAATALAQDCPLATRYPAPFEAAGVRTINPWSE
jgi:predicted nucleic acid-binding protein